MSALAAPPTLRAHSTTKAPRARDASALFSASRRPPSLLARGAPWHTLRSSTIVARSSGSGSDADTTDAAPAASTAGGVASHPLPSADDEQLDLDDLVAELKDPNQLGKRGEAWFVAQLALLLLIVWPPFALHGVVDALATTAVVAGLAVVAYGVASLGRSLSPLPAPRSRHHKLVTTGMFAYCRHPLYGGLLLAATGVALVTGSESRLLLTAALAALLRRKAEVEEAQLVARYGEEYEAYRARVPHWFVPYLF